jgi:hypothetical protein
MRVTDVSTADSGALPLANSVDSHMRYIGPQLMSVPEVSAVFMVSMIPRVKLWPGK